MKKMIKKVLFGALFVGVVAVMGACSETAEGTEKDSGGKKDTGSYPIKPIEVIVPAGAGGDTDLNTRIMGKHLEKELGKAIVVTNVNGAGGTTGTKRVLDAKPDGYTVLAFHNSMLLNNIYGLSDYTYSNYKIAGIGILDQSNTFITSKDSKFDDVESLIVFAKENPGEVTVATEIGSMTYIQMLEFQQLAGVEFNVVDVGGASDKITALLGGRVDIVPTSLGLVSSYIESGDFVSLGVIAEERLEGAPEVKTFKEQGVDLVVDKVFYWAFPKDTPDEIVEKFSQAMEKSVEQESFQEEIKKSWIEPVYLNAEQANKKISEIDALYRKVYEKSEGK